MAGKISFECPGCSTKLSVSDRSKLGKKIKCPKCEEVFTPDASADEEIEDFEDDMNDEVAPVRRGAGGQKRANAKPAKSDSPNGALIGGGIAAVIVLGGIGLVFSGVFNGAPQPINPVTTDASPQMVMSTPAMSSTPAAGAHSGGPPQTSMPGMSHGAGGPTMAANQTSAGQNTTSQTKAKITAAQKALGMGWMPAETDFIIHAKIGELWQAPLLKQLLNSPSSAAGVNDFQKMFGVQPSEVESITIGIVDLTNSVIKGISQSQSAPAFGPSGAPPINPEDIRLVMVAKSKKPIILSDAISKSNDPGITKQTANGKEYYAFAARPGSAAGGTWSPDQNTVIFATQTELMAILEKGETFVPRKEFTSIDDKAHVVIACTVRGLKKDELAAFESTKKELPAPLSMALKSNQETSLELAGIELNIRGGFDLRVFASSGKDDGASKIKSSLEDLTTQAKQSFGFIKASAPPLFAELGDLLVANLKVDSQNRVVRLSTSIPDSAQSKLEQLPPTLMLMAMTGGIPGMGGPAGGSPFGAPGASPFGAPGSPMMMNMGAEGHGGISLPGETESVPSVKIEGLPNGLTAVAKSGWSQFPAMSPDGTTYPSIEVLVDLTGDGLEMLCGATGITPKTASLSGGGKLKKPKPIAGIDPQKSIQPYDSSNDLQRNHPPQTLRVRMVVEAPPATAKSIDLFEGTFKLLISEKSQELRIEDVPSKVKRPLPGPDFKSAEIKLRRGQPGVLPESLTLTCGKDHFLGQIKGTPGEVMFVTETDKDQTIQRLISNHPGGKFPEDFELNFKVFNQVKEKTVTFRFENVPLPAPESKPPF